MPETFSVIFTNRHAMLYPGKSDKYIQWKYTKYHKKIISLFLFYIDSSPCSLRGFIRWAVFRQCFTIYHEYCVIDRIMRDYVMHG